MEYINTKADDVQERIKILHKYRTQITVKYTFETVFSIWL